MKRFWILVSILWLATCGGGGGSPTEPKEPAPVSNFTATPTTLIQGQAVTFTSTSTGTITSYAWNVDDDPAIDGTTATYAHTYTEVGTYSVTLTVTGPGGSNPKTVADMITVSTAAPTPTTETSQTVQEDGSTTISLTATDPNGQAVTFAITTDPTNGTATLSGTEITYTPNANFYGTDSFAYTASNGTYTSDPVTITITVEGEDDGNPTTNDVSATTDEDTVVTVDLDATEIDGDNYSFSIISQPTNGTLGSINGNQVEYTPSQDFNGTDTFTFEATDDRTFRRNVATATITVNPVNDAPVANDVTASMNENKEFTRLMPVTITLDATDVEGDDLTYSIVGTPSNGTLGSISDNQIIYTPSQDWNGTDTFTYKANDGTDDSNTATVTVTVTSVNDAPVTEDQTASTDEDTAVEITLTATDVENDNLTFTIVSDVSNGTTSLSGTTVTYTPTANFNGTDTFTFKANDGTDDSNVSTVTITVASVNDAPVANDVTASMNENKEFTRLMPVTITLDATDVEGDDLTYSIVGTPSNGTLGSITNNQVIYTPSQDYNGEDTFTYKANDGTDDSNTATVTVTINAVNDAPVTEDQTASTDEDTAVEITLTATDVENDNLTFTIVSDVSNGTTSLSGTTVTYTPDSNWNGTDTFTFKANDGTDDSNTSTITITVNAVNDAPVANDVITETTSRTGTMRQAINIRLDAYDREGDDLTYSLVSDVSNGTTSLSGNIVTYTPTANYDGEDTFKYKANDGELDSNIAKGTINITDIPNTLNQDISTNEDTAVDITLTATDVENDNLTFTIVSDVSNGTTSLSGATVTYTPDSNWNGIDTFTFKANDGSNDSNTSTVTITVASVNDAPVANDVTASTTSRTGNMRQAVTITLDATDVDGDDLTYSLTLNPVGDVSIQNNLLTYIPNQNFSGNDVFKYKANDGTVDSNTAIGTITITDINNAPIVESSSLTRKREDINDTLQLVASDIDGDALDVEILQYPSGDIVRSGLSFQYDSRFVVGEDSLIFKVNDGEFDSNIGVYKFNIEEHTRRFGANSNDLVYVDIARSANDTNYLFAYDEDSLLGYIYEFSDELSLIDTYNFTFNGLVSTLGFAVKKSQGKFLLYNNKNLLVLDENLNEVLSYEIHLSSSVGYKNVDVILNSNGDYILAGSVQVSPEKSFIFKIDSEGTLISEFYFDDLPFIKGIGLVENNSISSFNGYYTGSIEPASGRIIVKIDFNGNIVWKESIGDDQATIFDFARNRIILNIEDGICFDFGTRIRCVDYNGNPIKSKLINKLIGGLSLTSEGNFVSYGRKYFSTHGTSSYAAYLDSELNIIWEKFYEYNDTGGTSGYWRPHNVIESSDGNLIFLQTKKSQGHGGAAQGGSGGVFKVDINDGTKLLP